MIGIIVGFSCALIDLIIAIYLASKGRLTWIVLFFCFIFCFSCGIYNIDKYKNSNITTYTIKDIRSVQIDTTYTINKNDIDTTYIVTYCK